MRNRSSGSGGGGGGGGSARGGFNPTRFKPFDECPPDDHREFAVGANESTQVFRLYQVTRRTRAILFVAAAETPLPNLTFDINFNFSRTIPFYPAPSGRRRALVFETTRAPVRKRSFIEFLLQRGVMP